jgi:nucleoside-diphosphate-sugar epimerase
VRILVTGAGGFLGSRLAERLLEAGHSVRALVRPANVPHWLARRGAELCRGDLTDAAARAAVCRGCEIVVHAASLVTEVAVPDGAYFEVNARGTEELARAALRAKVRRFVFVGSTSVHRPNAPAPLDESSPLEGADAYARSKAEAERRLVQVAAEGALDLVIVRPSRIYGPRDRSLARVFRAIDRRRLLLVGPCRAEVDFVYVDDVVAALVAAIGRGSGVYLVGGPEPVSVERFLREVAAALGRRLPRLRLPMAPVMLAARCLAAASSAFGVEPPIAPKRLAFFRDGRVVDHSRARSDLGYRPQVAVREGIRRTARWYRDAGWL